MPVTMHQAPEDDLTPEEIERWRAIPVAVAVDLESGVGQIDPAIRPLRPPGQQPRLFGRAVTALCEPPDFGAVLHAVDLIASRARQPAAPPRGSRPQRPARGKSASEGQEARAASCGAVLVIAAAGDAKTAMIGEILGGHLRRLGAAGVVCDGAVRDVATLASFTDLPVFARSITPRGPASAERGAVNLPVVVGGQLVNPGDLVIGDDDGLMALSPAFIRARIGDAEKRLVTEAGWEKSLASGRSLGDIFGLARPRRNGG
jgi:4-hydroxy-4-methyl-2-oxoglutarate aldolase